MSWLVLKHGLQKAWLWCMHNWKVVALLVYTILLYLLFSKNARNAKSVLEETRKAHQAEIDSLNKAHSSELQKRNENQEVVKQIEQEYADRREALSAAKKKQVKDIVNEHGDDPQKLAELIRDSFGFEIRIGENDE
mgnify:CR=1 FL=1